MRGSNSRSVAYRSGVWALSVALLGVVGCSRKETSPAPTPAPRTTPTGLARGTDVVVEQAAGEFYQGKVLGVDAGTLKVQRVEGDVVDVPRSDAYPISAPATEPRPGSYAVCRRGEDLWESCRVVRREAEHFRVEDLQGRERRVLPEGVLEPTPLTRGNLERRFEQARASRSFQKAAQRAGKPRAPAAWRPGPRERVLALWEGQWFSARVIRIRDDGSVRVRWDRDGREAELNRRYTIPEPPYDELPRAEQFALLRPPTVSRPWSPVRVKRVDPRRELKIQEFVVENELGRTQRAAARDLVPLHR